MRDDGKRSRFESHRKRKKRKLQKRSCCAGSFFFDEGSGIGSALFSSRQKGFFGGKREKNLKLIRQTIYLSPGAPPAPVRLPGQKKFLKKNFSVFGWLGLIFSHPKQILH